jgi:hypothetical protein
VEIDESLFFKRKYNRGRHTEANWWLAWWSGVPGNVLCFLSQIEHLQRCCLLFAKIGFLELFWLVTVDLYRFLTEDHLFYHLTVNHSVNFVSPDSPLIYTQNIENCWVHAKKAKKYRLVVKRQFRRLFILILFKKFQRNTHLNKLILILSDMLIDQ